MVDTKLSIVDLPVELLLKIFKLLDTKSRSKVAATCNSWKSLTEDFFRWHLNVTPLFDSSYKELMRTKRKFSTIQITGQVSFYALSKFLHQTDISAAVTGATIKCATFRLIDFNEMLELFRNLEDLQLYSVTLCPDDDSNNESMKSPDLVHLKKLVFCVHTDERLLQSIAKAKLKTFVCREQTFTQIWNFLASQEDLNEIDVRRSSAESQFPDDAIKFSLQKLSFDFESALNFGILDLVWNQSYTIETVVLDRISAPLTYAMALSPLTNVTTLHIMPISVRNFPGNAFILPKLQSVTKLKIYDGVDYGYQRASIEELTIKFIECVPNLKDLDLAVPYKLTYLETIVENLSKLKSIRMSVSLDTKLEHLKYPPVENLRIKRFAFGKFGTVHPPVSMIAATAVYSTVTSLSYEGYTNKELLNVIRIMFPMLKQLDVLKSNFEFEQRAGLGAGVNICYRERDFFA